MIKNGDIIKTPYNFAPVFLQVQAEKVFARQFRRMERHLKVHLKKLRLAGNYKIIVRPEITVIKRK